MTTDVVLRSVDRLVDLARLGLDREAERAFLDDLVDAVAIRLDVPFVVIDVLLNEAQVFLATRGAMPPFVVEAGGTPVEWSFCLPLMLSRRPVAVRDLTADPDCRNPLVTVGGVRSYAGAPLISRRGHVLGGLCGLDVNPRTFAPAELEFLRTTAGEVVDRLEERAGPE